MHTAMEEERRDGSCNISG